MFGLCKYRDIFGMPNTGVHTYRIFDLAIVDILFTILGGWLIGYAIHRFVPWWNIPATIGGLFILGIVLHRMFCVRTTVDKILFPNAVNT